MVNGGQDRANQMNDLLVQPGMVENGPSTCRDKRQTRLND